MKHLAEIARIVDRGRDPREKPFEINRRGKVSRMARLYEGAISGSVKTDESAATEIFKVSPQDPAYATAKSRLKRRLLNTIMLLNLGKAGFSKFSQAQFIAFRSQFIVQALLILGGRKVAVKVARHALPFCKSYHLTQIELEFLQLFRTEASLKSDVAGYEAYSKRIEELLRNLAAEVYSSGLYGELVLHLHRRLKDVQELRKLASDNAEKLRNSDLTAETYTFKTNYYRINFYDFDLRGKFGEVIELCDEAINYYRSIREFESSVVVSEFAFRKLDACLKVRDIENGEHAARLAMSLLKAGSNNWFVIQMHYCLLLLHSSRFAEAYGLVREVMEHPRFSTLPPLMQENWKLYELHVLFAEDRLEAEGGKLTRVKPENRLETLLSITPTLSQDKQGHKVSLLILHILYLLEIGDFNGIIDRMEALRLYRARYLKAAQFPKTASFFKLLQIMENNSFAYKLVKEKGEKEYEKLIASTENQEEINEGLQILPYDWLWLKILDRLKEYEAKFAKRGF